MRVTFELEDRQFKVLCHTAAGILAQLEVLNAQLASNAADDIDPAAVAQLTARLKTSATALRYVVDHTQVPQQQ